ncbi:MAG: hypothetical protein AAF957_23280 [Planctomycetota bacterium]
MFAPGGQVLGRINTRSPERVSAMFDEALERWEALPADERRLPNGVELETAHRWELGYPEGGLAIERFSRDVGPDGLDAPPSDRWNRDTLWCSVAEVAEMLPPECAVGDRFELGVLADRLARFALVDDARGQTLPYAPEEVERATLTAEVVALDGERVELILVGATSASSDGTWRLGDNLWRPKRGFPHSIRCTLMGSAIVDLEAARFVDLDLVALGERIGRTQFNGRGRGPDLGPSSVGFHLSLAPDRLAPTFVAMYGVDWIPQPEVPTWRDSPDEVDASRRR